MSTTRRKSTAANSRAKGRKSPKGGPRKPRHLPAKAYPEYTFETEGAPTLRTPTGMPLEPRPRVQKTISYPKNWWQAVRERFAPTWWLARHPVEWKNVVYWEDAPPNDDPWTVEDIPAGTLVSINGRAIGRAGVGTSEFTDGISTLRITRTEPGIYGIATITTRTSFDEAVRDAVRQDVNSR